MSVKGIAYVTTPEGVKHPVSVMMYRYHEELEDLHGRVRRGEE